jgi:hypothetical protein
MDWDNSAFVEISSINDQTKLIASKMKDVGFTFFNIENTDTNKETYRLLYARVENELLKSNKFSNSSTFSGWCSRRIPFDRQLLIDLFSAFPSDVLDYLKSSHAYKVYHVVEVKLQEVASEDQHIMKLHRDFDDTFLQSRELIILAVNLSLDGALNTQIMCDLQSDFKPQTGPHTLYTSRTNAALFDGRNFHRGVRGEPRRFFLSLIDDSLHNLHKERITYSNGRVYLDEYMSKAISVMDVLNHI